MFAHFERQSFLSKVYIILRDLSSDAEIIVSLYPRQAFIRFVFLLEN